MYANEAHYQIPFCQNLGGKLEVTLTDRTRVDCLTNEYAIEVDFAKKWAESVGQSLHYGLMTNRKPAIGLIVGFGDMRHLYKVERLAKKFNIKIFVIKKYEHENKR